MSVPTFATPKDRAKVEKLMQPALIRVIDNIRKQLDETDWQGTYEENLVWPDGTTEAQKQTYAALQKGLHGVPPEEHDRVAAEMSALPQPSPLYTLKLTKEEQAEQTVDIWATCYQVCANQDGAEQSTTEQGTDEQNADGIEADLALFDDDGEVDWLVLDEKTKSIVAGIFQSLPD